LERILVKFIVSLTVLLCVWASRAQALSFATEAMHESIAKAYRFVTSKIPDPRDRAVCPIHVNYVPLDGYVGFTPRKTTVSECPDVIEITSRLEHDWKSGLVMAHELMHVFRHAANANEIAWLDEGIAKLVEHQYLGIGPITLQDDLLKLSEFALENRHDAYRDNSPAYVTAYFFSLYLYRHLGGDEFLKALISSPLSGWDAIEDVALKLKRRGVIAIDEKFLHRDSLWTHFAFALLLNDSLPAKNDLFKLDERYNAVKDTRAALLRSSRDETLEPGWRIRYFRWPLKGKDFSRPNDSNTALYLVRAGSNFSDFKVQAVSRKSFASAKSTPGELNSGFNYLIEVSVGD
jgi:hypothetical protein